MQEPRDERQDGHQGAVASEEFCSLEVRTLGGLERGQLCRHIFQSPLERLGKSKLCVGKRAQVEGTLGTHI